MLGHLFELDALSLAITGDAVMDDKQNNTIACFGFEISDVE